MAAIARVEGRTGLRPGLGECDFFSLLDEKKARGWMVWL